MLSRWLGIFALLALVTACARAPQPLNQDDVYSLSGLSVKTEIGNLDLTEPLEAALKERFVFDSVGAPATLTLTLLSAHYHMPLGSVLYGARHAASFQVVLKNAASGKTLNRFRLRALSSATNRDDARADFVRSTIVQLSRVYAYRAPVQKPIVSAAKPVAPSIPKPTAKPAKKQPAENFPVREEPAAVSVEIEPTPKALTPMAAANPDTAPEMAEEVTEEVAPKTPIAVAAPNPQPMVEPKVETSEDDTLCVVTLENDCAGLN